MKKRGVGVTDDLYRSVNSEFRQLAKGYLEGDTSFLVRGRFVDMGVGRGSTRGSTRGSFNLVEKPPNMPAYEEKGVTADQAKTLVAFMKAQKN